MKIVSVYLQLKLKDSTDFFIKDYKKTKIKEKLEQISKINILKLKNSNYNFKNLKTMSTSSMDILKVNK